MSTTHLRRRLVAATLGLAVAGSPLAAGALAATSGAAPVRGAATAVDTTYLSDTFPGLSASPVLETVTYDRFQWLLQQSGQYAFLIGSAADADFPAKVVAAEAAAKAAGAVKVYWFDPNLTGQTGVKNLDTRNPGGINLATGSQTIYGNIWKNALGQYLGNGIKSVPNAAQTTATVSADDTVVNDAVDPLWDYRSSPAAPPVAAADDVFFVYDKDNTSGGQADKIVKGVNLSATATGSVGTAVTAALAGVTGGAAAIDQLDQFHWWKDAANRKHDLSYTDDARYGGNILDDADNADGWRVKQITYPELLHLLSIKDTADKNFVLLFGGTWCHNTRAVLKHVNEEAQENGVTTVYNFDLVLDGGTTNGTNGGSNPIHVRDNANSGSTFNFRPSYVYGDVVRSSFRNLVTEYDPNTGSRVSYYPNGDLAAFPDVVRKLQVPFLINYQRGTGTNPSSTAVKRQWIQQNLDASTGLPTFREYMSEWWFTKPSAQLGLSFPIPADESTLTAPQATQLSQARDNVTFAQDALAKLDDFFGGLPGAVVSTQTVTAPTVAYGTAPKITVAIANKFGRLPAGTATLTVGGASYPVQVAQNAAVFTVAKLVPGSYPFTVSYAGDDQIVSFSKAGTLTVAKAKAKASGAAVKVPTSKKAGTYKVTVATPAGLVKATGKVTLTLSKGAAKKKVVGTLKAGVVTVTVPKLAKGGWKVAIGYAGDAKYLAATAAGKAITVKR
ncbi:Ig-like domain repeat protein [Nocardioides marmoriginsengisoli]|uniref:Ig-like domain repeat protein n=1 Tax=Nocardioides marmoriginsengisoli TaxID=661483 RepID=A0A3N0CI37_9ACTN|nr:Ig-like domain-containing protein [Nocardioides marmoriginsengisoli]RNL63090.1 Ig-like domain repeat protein [Nocardioides marmoriginsengisoli]